MRRNRPFGRRVIGRLRQRFARAALGLAAGGVLAVYPQVQLQVGYAVVTPPSGGVAPVATALFTYTNPAGVLVSQAGVGAAAPISSGRIFVDETGTQTGIALVNPGARAASVALTLRNAAGREVDRTTRTLSPGEHLPRFVAQMFANLPAAFTGTLTFESSEKVAAITLRQSRNAQGEVLYATLPVVDLGAAQSTAALVFSQVAAGDGYTTQLVLMNPTAQAIAGEVRFTDSGGSALSVRLDGVVAAQFRYRIDPHGAARLECDRPSGLGVGYATVTPDGGNVAPAGTAIFQFRRGAALVTEAGVASSPATTLARIFADGMGTYTGVALANSEDQTAAVSFTLRDLHGTAVGVATRSLRARGHMSVFAHELFPGTAESSSGVIDIASTAAVAAITLRQTDNARGDSILTTLPVGDLRHPPPATQLVFPQIAIGEGFSTRLILIHGGGTAVSGGTLAFHQSSGAPMTVPLAGRSDSRFTYEVAASGARQYRPGNSAAVASIALLDAATNVPVREVAVNEGKSVRPKVQVVDTAGAPRDDFELAYSSLSPEVATVDASGLVAGKKTGFSTLTIVSGSVVAVGTVTVASVSGGAAGYQITGVAADLARRVYLADPASHTLLVSESASATPALYAGVPRTPGLRNDVRLAALFREPGLLAFNQSDGTLYVADAANHVIRRVQPGPAGRATTLAGTGTAGSLDGAAAAARFNKPRGVALDGRGSLWVADTDNHTVRRVRLATGVVETVAGRAGASGWADGIGGAARFSAPVGIAVEPEPLAEQFERERKGLAAPPVTVIVADRDNGILRRVKESGEVETIRERALASPDGRPARPGGGSAGAPAPLGFTAPEGVAVDPAGAIYVTEPTEGRVRVVLPTGERILAAQTGTFTAPAGIVAAAGGRLLVADGTNAVRELGYAEPRITSVTPDRIGNAVLTTVTIRGSNFAPETAVILGGTIASSVRVRDTGTITFTAPIVPSGGTTLTLQHRGGLAQHSVLVEPVPLASLAAGMITTVAGGGTFAGDGGSATTATLNLPTRVAYDAAGNLYVADSFHFRIRRVSAATGIATTVAGTGTWSGARGDGGPAIAATLRDPYGVAVDDAGNVYIADTAEHCVRKIAADTGIITTVAGRGPRSVARLGDGGPATGAILNRPSGIAVDPGGDLYIADTDHNRIRRVARATGVITTVAGNDSKRFAGDGGPATDASLAAPTDVAIDAAGNFYIADAANHRIRKVTAATGIITTVAGQGTRGYSGDGGQAVAASLNFPTALSLDTAGNLYVADRFNHRVRRIAAATGIITTAAGNGTDDFRGDGGAATAASLSLPEGVAVDAAGRLAIADTHNRRVRRVEGATATITTVAGTGQPMLLGDGGHAAGAQFWYPQGIAFSASGDLFIADSENNRVRRVEGATATITTVAGTGEIGSDGDGGPATAAEIDGPSDVAVDASGNLFILEWYGNRIRRVAASTGIITAFAGDGYAGFSGDGGPAASATLSYPGGITVDRSGNVYIADSGNHRVRKVTVPGGIITTIAGSGVEGFAGDGGPATAARLASPAAVAFDTAGNLFIADQENQRIRKVASATGVITTVAGTGTAGFSGDRGPATSARFNYPQGIAVDAAGNLFVADTMNGRVRRVDAGTGIVTTVAGSGATISGGDSGPAVTAGLLEPWAVAFDSRGNLYISDGFAYRIRAVRGPIP